MEDTDEVRPGDAQGGNQDPKDAKLAPLDLSLRPQPEVTRESCIDRIFGRCLVGHYRTALIDPPWPERGSGKIKRGADRHYDTLPVSEMPRVILASAWNPMPDAHLYMWATNTHLMKAGWLIETLGFRYITPEKAFQLVERASPGRYIEIFGRGMPREGWQIWGNEAGEIPGLPAEP